MRALRVYVDTSVIGGCLDEEFHTWSNRLLRDFQEGRFVPVVSSVVAAEIEAAPEAVREKFEEILRLDPEFLEITEGAAHFRGEASHLSGRPPHRCDEATHLCAGAVLSCGVAPHY